MTMKSDIRTERARLVKVIHVARRELAMDEDTYRLMLVNVGGSDSTMNMDQRQLKAVLDHLKRKGFKVRASRSSGAAPRAARQTDRRQADDPSARKVRALWLFLDQLGALRDPSEAALAAYCKRIAKVDDMHWATNAGMVLLIETLKSWARRLLPAAISALAKQLAEVAEGEDPARAHAALWAMDAAQSYLARGLGYDLYFAAWSTLTEALGQPVPADLVDAQPAAAQS